MIQNIIALNNKTWKQTNDNKCIIFTRNRKTHSLRIILFSQCRAQILYRLEQYQDCYNLYRDIVKNTTDEYEDERKANMAAVVANLAALNPVSV